MEIKSLSKKNLEDIARICVCDECVEWFAKDYDVNIKRVKEGFAKGKVMRVDWIKKRLPLGYGAKIAYEAEKPIGFIDYLPIEAQKESISGKDITLINCIFIIPGSRDKGYSKFLLYEAEEEAEKISRGIAVIAHKHPEWMPADYFAKRGYKVVDSQNGSIKQLLMFKKFQPTESPKFLRQKYGYKQKSKTGRVVVEIVWSGRCPHNQISVELLKEVLDEFGDKVIIKEVITNELESDVIRKYGLGYGIYVNGKPNFWLLGASKEEIRQKILS